MKKFFYIASAAMISVLALASCAEKEIVTYNPENAVPPVVETVLAESYVLEEGGAFATLTFSKADFNLPTGMRYTAYADINEDFSTKRSLASTTEVENGIVIDANTINAVLMNFNCPSDIPVQVYLRVEAEMFGESSVISGVSLVSTTLSTVITPFYAPKTYPSVYVIGGFCGWDHGQTAFLFSYSEDEENYTGVVDFGEGTTDFGFKLTGAADWDHGNWGTGASSSTEPEAPSVTLIDDGGSGNISNYTSHRYYNFHFVKSTLTLSPVVWFDGVTLVVGSTEVPMECDRATGHFHADAQIAEGQGYTVRVSGGNTDVVFGGNISEVVAGGDPITVDAGNYRVYIDLNDWDNPTTRISTDDYGTGSDEPEQPEQPEIKDNLWGVIGTFEGSDWTYDIYMTEFPAGSGIWTSPALAFEETTAFKIRFNNSWDTQAGAAVKGEPIEIGVPTAAGGEDIGVAADQVGKQVIVYNANTNEIFLLGWSAHGMIDGDSWTKDVPMVFDASANTWTTVVPAPVQGEFKLRWAGDWTDNRGLADGASFSGSGIAFDVVKDGPNIGGAMGNYNMTYDVTAETLTLTTAE